MRRGFTLIELVVVLLILALLTHVAVRELGQLQTAKAREQAGRQLENLRDAAWHAVPGEEPTGFLVDMGRLPQAVLTTNEQGRAVCELSELWRRPEGVLDFALRQATATNFVGDVEAVDENVWIPCGWRGPYLRLPLDRDRLLDPWGNAMTSPDDAGFARLLTSERLAVAAGGAVVRVRHLGTDGRPDNVVTPGDLVDRDAEIDLRPGRMANDLVVMVTAAETLPANLRLRWYMPSGSAITGGVATVSGSRQFVVNGLAPGVCTMVVDADGAVLARERLVIPPGGRVHQLKLP